MVYSRKRILLTKNLSFRSFASPHNMNLLGCTNIEFRLWAAPPTQGPHNPNDSNVECPIQHVPRVHYVCCSSFIIYSTSEWNCLFTESVITLGTGIQTSSFHESVCVVNRSCRTSSDGANLIIKCCCCWTNPKTTFNRCNEIQINGRRLKRVRLEQSFCDQFAGMDFGHLPLTELHLCLMGRARDENGFYRSVGRVPLPPVAPNRNSTRWAEEEKSVRWLIGPLDHPPLHNNQSVLSYTNFDLVFLASICAPISIVLFDWSRIWLLLKW